jgi:peptidoglycan/LPS O-acetylase OafA/YrhL
LAGPPNCALACNGPGWSLSAEAFFYLVFPFVAPALWPLTRRGLLLSLLALWGLAQLAPALYALAPAGGWLGGWQPPPDFWIAAFNDVPYRRWENPWYAFIQYNPLGRLPEFLFGVALGRLYLLRPDAAPRPAAWSLAAAAAVAALVAALAGSSEEVRHSLFFHNGLLTPLYGLLVVGLARGRLGLFSRTVSVRPLVVLGEASYALYILHLPLLMILEAASSRPAVGDVAGLSFFARYALVTVLASVAVLRWVEEPARRLLRRWFARFV